MTLNFDDPEIAAKLNTVIRKIVNSELDKNRPKPRYAIVNSINLEEKYCMVTYTGETDAVRVPFNSVVPNEIGQSVRIEGTPGDRYIAAIRGTSKAEADLQAAAEVAADAVSRADSAAEAAESASNQIENLENEVFTRTTRPLYRGLNPTGESSFDYQLLSDPGAHTHGMNSASGDSGSHTHTILSYGTSEIASTSSLIHMAFIKCEISSRKDSLYFKARRSSNLVTCYVDIYIMEDIGSWRWVSTTPNIALDIGLSKSWINVSTERYTSTLTDIIGVQFRVVGVGTLYLDGRAFPQENYPPTVRPLNVAMMRTVNSAPEVIPSSEADTRYSFLLAYVEYGALTLPPVQPREYFDQLNNGTIANWPYYDSNGGGSHLNISNNRMINPSNQLLAQRAMRLYKSQVNTDKWELEWTLTSSTTRDAESGVVACASTSMTRFLTVRSNADDISIVTYGNGISGGATIRASASWRGGSGRFKLRFNIEDRRVIVYPPNSETPIVQWVDSGNYLYVGKGNRYAGIFIEHLAFNSGQPVDDFAYRDIVDDEEPVEE